MSTFKIGDRVEYFDGIERDTGVIIRPHSPFPDCWWVKWDSDGNTFLCSEEMLKLIDDSNDAASILQQAKDCLVNRGVERDKPNGERSMKSTVEAFNAITGHSLSEEQGWIFMVALKMARSQGGCYKADDYIDMAAYAALAGEAGANNAN